MLGITWDVFEIQNKPSMYMLGLQSSFEENQHNFFFFFYGNGQKSTLKLSCYVSFGYIQILNKWFLVITNLAKNTADPCVTHYHYSTTYHSIHTSIRTQLHTTWIFGDVWWQCYIDRSTPWISVYLYRTMIPNLWQVFMNLWWIFFVRIAFDLIFVSSVRLNTIHKCIFIRHH